MNSIFKIVTSEQWDEAKITGLVPRCSADIEHNCVHVNEYDDLDSVCARFFNPKDNPIVLEFAPDSYSSAELQWREATKENPWREGRLMIDNLLADLVLNIYSFQHEQTANGIICSLQGE